MIFLFIKPLCCGAEMLLPLQMDLSMNVIFLLFLLEIDGRERNMPQVNNSSQNIKLRASLTHIAAWEGRNGLNPKK